METSVTCLFRFESAHQLPMHPGKCKNLHGHGYKLEVSVSGKIGEDGMIVDFADLEQVVEREVITRYDHKLLNDIIPNPTAELIALDAWELLSNTGIEISRLRLFETPDCYVEITK